MPDASPSQPPGRRPEPRLTSPDYVGGLAGAVFPGLGHLVRGRTRRGVLAMVGVMGLFLYGLLIGGIDAVDSREDKIWFYGAVLLGPTAFATDWVHQNHFKALDPSSGRLRTGNPGEVRSTGDDGRAVWRSATAEELAAGKGPPNGKGLGRLNEIAMLSIALAGMLNLIVFLDALLPGMSGKGSGVKRPAGVGGLSAAAVAAGAVMEGGDS
jgi:hypothetical protein